MKRMKIERCRNKLGFIDLNKLKNYREKGTVVEGSNAKVWFNVDGERFLFKEYNSVLPCFGEVLYYRAAKAAGIKCAEYDFAVLGDKVGTISYDFLKENETYYNFLELTSQFGDSSFDLENISTNKDLLILQNNKYNNLNSIKDLLSQLFHVSVDSKKRIEMGLIEMFCLDALFWHQDRTLWNYGAIVNEETDDMRLSDIHDNSYVLCLNRGEEYIEEAITNIINDGLLDTPRRKVSSFELYLDGDDSIEQLIEFYSNSDEDIRMRIDNVFKSINVDDLVKSTLEDCKIGDVAALWVKAVLKYRGKTILKGLESVKINDDEAVLPNVVFSKRK